MQIGLNLSLTLEHGGAGAPTLDMTFTGTGNALDPRITFTRASNATQFDSAGNLVYAPNNWIRNNTMQGAVAGTPGTLPTNWLTDLFSVSGISRQIVGTGTENGITYIDIRLFGTSAVTSTALILLDANNAAAASPSQKWTVSSYVKIQAGSLTGIASTFLEIFEYSSVPTYLRQVSAGTFTPTTAGLSTQRVSGTVTTGASTAFTRASITVEFTGGVAADITLRIGLPQLEIGPVATAVNPTSGTAYQGPRFDYNPATLAARGLLIEEQRTNSIRNNTMQGAVAGTPGTLPTNWSTFTTLTGLTRTVVGTGTEHGITYVDIRVNGTPSAAGIYGIYFEPATQVAAASGQTWASSSYCKLASGSLAGVTEVRNTIAENNSGGSFLAGSNVPFTPTSAALNTQRFAVTRTLNNASTAFIIPYYDVLLTGADIDITLRIGLPQLELGAFATSVIPTTTTALTRSADVASVNTLSPWFNASAGTLFNEVMLYALPPSGTFPTYSDINNGTTNNRVALSSNGFADHRITARNTSGILSDTNAGGSISVNVASKWALAYASGDYAASANGGAVVTSATAGLPSGLNLMTIGRAAGANQANVWIRRITYYPRRLSNAELQAITA